MSRQWMEEKKILNAVSATGSSSAYYIADYQHIMATVSSSGSATFTVKFQGSFSDEAPDFSAAQSSTNKWDYIQVKDYQNNSSIDGDTGISFTGTDDVRMVELNTNGIKWVAATITARTGGTITVGLTAFNNQ